MPKPPMLPMPCRMLSSHRERVNTIAEWLAPHGTSEVPISLAHLYELCRACGGAFDMEPVSALAPPRKRAEQSAWWEDQKYLAEVRRSRWRSALALDPHVERPLAALERSDETP